LIALCCSIEPSGFLLTLNDHRHPIVNAAHEFVGRTGSDRKAFEQRAVGLFAGISKSGEAKELAVFVRVKIQEIVR
jgi:hypothetical protein